jgi:hypothetical protein
MVALMIFTILELWLDVATCETMDDPKMKFH